LSKQSYLVYQTEVLSSLRFFNCFLDLINTVYAAITVSLYINSETVQKNWSGEKCLATQ